MNVKAHNGCTIEEPMSSPIGDTKAYIESLNQITAKRRRKS